MKNGVPSQLRGAFVDVHGGDDAIDLWRTL
jgi:hypothetical protein